MNTTSQTSRREFIKTTGKLTAVSALAAARTLLLREGDNVERALGAGEHQTFEVHLAADDRARRPRSQVVLRQHVPAHLEAQADAVRGYVREGGGLVATGETSLCDELGRPRRFPWVTVALLLAMGAGAAVPGVSANPGPFPVGGWCLERGPDPFGRG